MYIDRYGARKIVIIQLGMGRWMSMNEILSHFNIIIPAEGNINEE
jgi:hypothetical protein